MYSCVEMIYNSERRHATLGYLSLNTFEAQRLGRQEIGAFLYQPFPDSSSVEASKGRK